ncbi:hypothetical protein E2C01_063007 [Portunus trituberculatus]|uniref:Uncharacterized protein n=1 Tax=Portunus trituberculatus TaxID=210409 RepID=A0A5B7HHL7_PORTR|nr:hypothetical protein [Portunus trituberculatus]
MPPPAAPPACRDPACAPTPLRGEGGDAEPYTAHTPLAGLQGAPCIPCRRRRHPCSRRTTPLWPECEGGAARGGVRWCGAARGSGRGTRQECDAFGGKCDPRNEESRDKVRRGVRAAIRRVGTAD